MFAPGHLGELTQIVPFEMVDAALEATRTVQRRTRDLPSRVVVYLLLAGALFAECGYRGVTPDDEHEGRGEAIRKARQAGLEQARLRRLATHRAAREDTTTPGPDNVV